MMVGTLILSMRVAGLMPAGLADLSMLLFQAIWAGILLFNTKLAWRKT